MNLNIKCSQCGEENSFIFANEFTGIRSKSYVWSKSYLEIINQCNCIYGYGTKYGYMAILPKGCFCIFKTIIICA